MKVQADLLGNNYAIIKNGERERELKKVSKGTYMAKVWPTARLWMYMNLEKLDRSNREKNVTRG